MARPRRTLSQTGAFVGETLNRQDGIRSKTGMKIGMAESWRPREVVS